MFQSAYFPDSYWPSSYFPKVGLGVPVVEEPEPFVRRRPRRIRARRHAIQESTVRVIFGGRATAELLAGRIDPALRQVVARLGFAVTSEIAGALVQDGRTGFSVQAIGVGRTIIGRWPNAIEEAVGNLRIYARASAKIENPTERAKAFELALLESDSTDAILRKIIEYEEGES